MQKFLLPLALLLVAPVANAQCTINSPGAAILPTVFDGWYPNQALGFAFPFAGATYTHIWISDHSICALNNAGTPVVPLGGSFVWNPFTASLPGANKFIAPYWSDHNVGPAVTSEIYIDNTSGGYCTITWRDMVTFGQTLPWTVQMTLFANGTIVMCLDNRVINEGSTFGALNAIMAISDGSALPPMSDISAGPTVTVNSIFEEWATPTVGTPNPAFDVDNSTITFIPTNPGWVVIFDTLACASTTAYGTGCGGVALSTNLPVLGTNWVLTTTGLTIFDAITFFGAAQAPGIPFPVLGIDSPGCSLWIAALVGNASAPNVAGTANLTIPLPLNASLKDAGLTAQSLTLSLAFPSLLAASNGVESILGW